MNASETFLRDYNDLRTAFSSVKEGLFELVMMLDVREQLDSTRKPVLGIEANTNGRCTFF